ncbi:MAG: Cof-type HAD-IIB family hydrolase [Clostridia bacterium]|nr:Cof-type HAD-IIB family hydrolase [Clostridia bacterium]
MKYKMIFCDLDDTLIDSNQVLGRKTINAVKKYQEVGGIFVICTGRMTVGAIPVCKKLNLKNELISYQGAVITDLKTNNVVFSTNIKNEDAIKIAKFAEKKKNYIQTYDGDYFYTQEATSFTKMYGELSMADYVETKIPLSEFLEKSNINPPKMLLMDNPEKIPQILKDFSKFEKKFLINTSKPFIIEIIPKDINKGLAVKKVAEIHNVELDDIICVGDSDNDLKMLEVSGLPIVVENGTENAKKIAKYIAPNCNENPIATIIEKFCLDNKNL